MRIVSVAAFAVLCTGCATVSMKPANITASFAKPKSDLYKASDEYCDMARDQGWIENQTPMALLKRTLFPDAETDAEKAPHKEYYETIGVESDSPDLVEIRLVEDISAAASMLSNLNVMAESMIVTNADVERSDVSGFEEALVAARKSRRSFSEAQTLLMSKRNWVSERAEASIDEFDGEIEIAKSLADQLAGSWRNESEASS